MVVPPSWSRTGNPRPARIRTKWSNVISRWMPLGSDHMGAGAGSYMDRSQPSWISRPMTVQVIALVIDQLGVARSACPNALYRSVSTRSGEAISTP